MKDDATAAGDDPLDGLAGFGAFFQGFILHFLHHLKAAGFLPFFLGDRLVNISRHDGL